MKKIRIGVTLRTVRAPNYDEKRDALSHDWPAFLEKMEMTPIYIPNNLKDINIFLKEVNLDGVIISGGDNIGDDPDRDNTERKVLEFCITGKKPVFGVCRGMQVINKFFGGDIKTDSGTSHVRESHTVKISNVFSYIFNSESITVNSFHNNVITKQNIGNGLTVFAYADDSTIEGFYHKTLPIVGVMWHPERTPDKNNQAMLQQLFKERKLV